MTSKGETGCLSNLGPIHSARAAPGGISRRGHSFLYSAMAGGVAGSSPSASAGTGSAPSSRPHCWRQRPNSAHRTSATASEMIRSPVTPVGLEDISAKPHSWERFAKRLCKKNMFHYYVLSTEER